MTITAGPVGSVPPVRQSTLVRAPLAATFETFVRTIDAWWPKLTHSVGKERARRVVLEAHAGGRFYEEWDDGTTHTWGELTVWEPPDRFVMTWLNTPAPTEVELTFRAEGEGTRVAVEHRGWEALSVAQRGEDCAAPGGYTSGSYSSGWAMILERMAGTVATAIGAGVGEAAETETSEARR
jgi:hypothetical protein